ncbi:MAG: cation transporter [Deltaproteobacteria bacterium]|nr:cation transporter [Deltaproteobacteria bacterium]
MTDTSDKAPTHPTSLKKKGSTAAFRATVVNIVANVLLFVLKLWAAVVSGSVALLSEAFNSLSDAVSAIAIFIAVKVSGKEADESHPFGHNRAEPIAGIVVAIFAGILGFEIIRTSIGRLISGGDGVVVGSFALAVPVVTMGVKVIMAIYFKRVGRAVNSPAIMAGSTDSLFDVFLAFAALIGIVGVRLGYPWLDPTAGLVISIWIIYAGYKIGIENIDYLMGKAPPKELTEDIRRAALGVAGVRDTNTIRAHYVGHYIHVEIHVEVASELSTYDSHGICEVVEEMIELLPAIEKAFVHIDPV